MTDLSTNSAFASAEHQAIILDGALAAKAVLENLKEKIIGFTTEKKRPPALAVVLIGNDPASEVYVKNKIATCKKIGIESQFQRYPSNATTDEVINCIKKLNADDTIDGILLQLPLPGHLPTNEILDVIVPHKDVDGLHPYNLGLLFAGVNGLQPCTPKGIINLLQFYKIPIKGKNAVVIGRSNLVGKPIAGLLLQNDATVTICHSRTANLPELCRQADILVVAVGKQEMVRGDWIKPNACVVDVGIHRPADSKIVGDVCFDEAKNVASYITPVPGGVGKMTVAMLMVNTVIAYEKHLEM
jgi:methylenetetrahydrofolate dehydrogenase (NADP+)/methenyltetrahydrofolate cyclohydrolase